MMKNRLHLVATMASVLWMLFAINTLGDDLKFAKDYYLFPDRVAAAYRAEVAAYEKRKADEQEQIQLLLEAANRYQELQFLSLAAKRFVQKPLVSTGKGVESARQEPDPEYVDYQIEIDTLEKIYGKATLRKFRPQETTAQQSLYDDLQQRLPAPHKREPRLAASLLQILSVPLAVLLTVLIFEFINERFPKWTGYFRIAERLPALTTLSVPQRVIAAGAGVLVLSIQLYDFVDDGIDGIAWIVSLALVAGLFIMAIHGVEKVPRVDRRAGIDEQ